jgi:hypothetical protein
MDGRHLVYQHETNLRLHFSTVDNTIHMKETAKGTSTRRAISENLVASISQESKKHITRMKTIITFIKF